MKNHLIVAGIIRQEDKILLVKQQYGDKSPEWSIPGGGVDQDELFHEALIREIQEETGLIVKPTDIGKLLYAVQVAHPDKSQSLTHVYHIRAWSGTLKPDDPDNHILQAVFLSIPEALQKLKTLTWPVMHAPITAYLKNETTPGTTWLFRHSASEGGTELVARLT